jgi:hypothetical protein
MLGVSSEETTPGKSPSRHEPARARNRRKKPISSPSNCSECGQPKAPRIKISISIKRREGGVQRIESGSTSNRLGN